MAETVESATAANVAGQVPTQEEFHELLAKLKTQETKLTEAKGRMGKQVEQAVADLNLHTDALRIVRKYLKKSPEAAASFLLHLDLYWSYMHLGMPANDMLETPAERKSKARKPLEVIGGNSDARTRKPMEAAE